MPRKVAPDGRQQLRIGTRTDNRVFKFNRSWSGTDVDRAKQQLKDVFAACHGWNKFSDLIADNLKKGVSPVPIPSTRIAKKKDYRLKRAETGLDSSDVREKLSAGGLCGPRLLRYLHNGNLNRKESLAEKSENLTF